MLLYGHVFTLLWGFFPCHDISGFCKFCSGVFINHRFYYLALSKSVDNPFKPGNQFFLTTYT
jgi:hypothetical protein